MTRSLLLWLKTLSYQSHYLVFCHTEILPPFYPRMSLWHSSELTSELLAFWRSTRGQTAYRMSDAGHEHWAYCGFGKAWMGTGRYD